MITFFKTALAAVCSGIIGMVLGILLLVVLKFLAWGLADVSITITSQDVCGIGFVGFLIMSLFYVVFVFVREA